MTTTLDVIVSKNVFVNTASVITSKVTSGLCNRLLLTFCYSVLYIDNETIIKIGMFHVCNYFLYQVASVHQVGQGQTAAWMWTNASGHHLHVNIKTQFASMCRAAFAVSVNLGFTIIRTSVSVWTCLNIHISWAQFFILLYKIFFVIKMSEYWLLYVLWGSLLSFTRYLLKCVFLQ